MSSANLLILPKIRKFRFELRKRTGKEQETQIFRPKSLIC